MNTGKWVVVIYILFAPVMGGVSVFAQSCIVDYPAVSYYRADATSATEEDARAQALSRLVAQFPSTYSARKLDRQTEVNGALGGTYSATMEVSSKLRLMGVQYALCSGKRRTKTYTVVAYISKQDLERSAVQVGAKVQEYVDLMGAAGSESYVREGLVGYLYAHLSPRPVQIRAGGIDRPDAEAWLESVLREHLSGLRLTCLGVEEQNGYPGQLVLNMNVQGGARGVDLVLEVPAYNARDRISAQGGPLHVIMEPALRQETIRLMVSLLPQVLPAELREVAATARINREMALQVDFSQVISLAIAKEDRGRDWLLKPDVKGLSIRQCEWLVDGKQKSFQTQFIVPKSEDLGKIRLRVNESDDLTADLVFRGNRSNISPEAPRSGNPSAQVPSRPDATPMPRPIAEKTASRMSLTEIPNSILQIAAVSEPKVLEMLLGNLQRSGKITAGRKKDFQDPDRCWVAVFGRETQKILYLLAPGRMRMDVVTSKKFSDFETELAHELNGSAVLWLEVYDQN